MAAGELRQLLDALAHGGVRFIVVGSVAVVLHGHPRLTVDLDLVVALDSENVRAAIRALSASAIAPALRSPRRHWQTR